MGGKTLVKSIAIIDIGSNNIKLEIHKVSRQGRTELAYSDKVPARLGHEAFITHRLVEENIEVAVSGITQFSKIIKNFDCKEVVALGTAALRESDNEFFLKRVKKASGIKIKVISGVEEARLVYLGVLANTSFKGRTFFLNDIGGGSTEISVSDEKTIHYIESLPLGTLRLKELFELDQNKRSKVGLNHQVTRHYVEKFFTPFARKLKVHSFEMGMCTGGTARNLAEIIRLNHLQKWHEEDGIPILETSALKILVSDIIHKPPKELSKLTGIDKQRVDIIVPGAILLLSMLEMLNIKKSLVLAKGLRDGALADFVHKRVNHFVYNERQQTSRKLGLQKLSDKYNTEKQHAEQCTSLALRLFDILQEEHRLKPAYRDILEGGALLHDIGSYISYQNHHKHSEYLIMNSELPEFSLKEKQWISLIARYHKKGFPKPSHKSYDLLKEKDKEMILKLSAMVRIADALDRSYQCLVKDIELKAADHKKIQLAIKGSLTSLWSFGA